MNKHDAIVELLRIANLYVEDGKKDEVLQMIHTNGVSATKGIVYSIDENKIKDFSEKDHEILKTIFVHHV